jgi:GNAT superfamily N-acetyltransferase
MLTLRSATAADRHAVERMFAQHLAALSLTPDPKLDDDVVCFDRWYVPPHGRLLLGVNAADTAIGMAGLLRGEVRRVFVEPPWHRRGVARQLVAALMREGPLPASGRVSAWVGTQNTASHQLFLSLGFALAETQPQLASQRGCCRYDWVAAARCIASAGEAV